MRKIYVDMENIGLSNGDVVTIELLNSVGLACTTESFFSLNAQYTISDSVLEVELLENDKIKTDTHYKITLPNESCFTFVLPSSSEDDNPPHELTSLIKMGCFQNIVKDDVLNTEFVEKLNLYFTGENPHFTHSEQSLVDMYIFYADKVFEDGLSTIDITELMDEHMARILPTTGV